MSLQSRSRVKPSVVLTESRSCIYTQLYEITSKYYFKTYFYGSVCVNDPYITEVTMNYV